jgi:dimeric dUTPase (all-alpha-NTP-PPase superfamily)
MSIPHLFSDWLIETKELQEQFYGKKFEDFDHDELVQWVRINILAAEDELHEALGEISWKPWAKSEFFNREAYLGEIVDVLHFVGNLLVGAGITDAELNEAYLDKMERNRQRQRTGYTGLDKCMRCKRAVDDIVAHGGKIAEVDDQGNGYCDQCMESVR